MRRVQLHPLLLVFLSALLQIVSFPVAGPLPFWRSILAWFALVPLLSGLLFSESKQLTPDWWRAAKLGYLCGVLFYLGDCYWIYQTMYLYGGLPKLVAAGVLLLFALYLALYHGLFAALIGWVGHGSTAHRNRALFMSPFAWVAVELARARITGFPWNLLGYSQIDNGPMLRIAPWAGVMGISFVLAAASAVIVYLLAGAAFRKKVFVTAASIVLVGGLMLAGKRSGATQIDAAERAVLLQENLMVGVTAQKTRPLSPQEEVLEFARLTLSPPGNFRPHATIVLWPEAPSHLIATDHALQAALGELARRAEAPMIIGSIGIDQNTAVERGYSEYDSAALFDQAGTYRGRYDKIHLVPWGEYVPYKQFFAFAKKLTEGAGDMDRGTERTLFRTDGHAFGIFICYESIFGDEVRQFVQNGAQVLVNISDDGWYGDTGAPWQHLNMARMRAVENDRWLLRDTNTGETTVIDPEGRYTPTARHVRTSYVLPFAFRSDVTFYTRHGDWFAYLCALVTVITGGFAFARRNALD